MIAAFYTGFQKRDSEAMAACYHPEVTFSDPVFVGLRGEQASDMWRMLCARGKDLVVEFGDVHADEASGGAHWEAWYTFGATGRKVHNVIDAMFEFKDGKIVRHTDSFDFRAWAAQALGLAGRLLGGTRFVKNKVRATAMRGLEEFTKTRSPE